MGNLLMENFIVRFFQFARTCATFPTMSYTEIVKEEGWGKRLTSDWLI